VAASHGHDRKKIAIVNLRPMIPTTPWIGWDPPAAIKR